MKQLRALNSYQIFKIKNKKSKTYSGWFPFQGLSNGTTSHADPIWLDGTTKETISKRIYGSWFLVLGGQVEDLEYDGEGEDPAHRPDGDHPALLPNR